MQRHGRLPFMLVFVMCVSCVNAWLCVCCGEYQPRAHGEFSSVANTYTTLRSRCWLLLLRRRCCRCCCCSSAYQCGAFFFFSLLIHLPPVRQLCAAHVSTLTQRIINKTNVVAVLVPLLPLLFTRQFEWAHFSNANKPKVIYLAFHAFFD